MKVVDFCDGGIDVEEAAPIVDVVSKTGIVAVEASGDGIGHHMTWLVRQSVVANQKIIFSGLIHDYRLCPFPPTPYRCRPDVSRNSGSVVRILPGSAAFRW